MPDSPAWDPDRYLAFADERSRPFVDLLARVPATAARTVVDLGCGPGTLTRLLQQRWPRARVVGVDSSPQMVERARAEGVEAHPGDVREWAPKEPVDVVVTNAVLQWVPGHLDLLPRVLAHVAPGGWLALQVPGNHDEPTHALRRELAAEQPYRAHTRDLPEPHAHDPADYLDALAGCDVDAWETTYLHVLRGEDPVLTWVSGTGARPVLQALPDDLRPAFEAEYRRRLDAAYPRRPDGSVLLPFRRVFAVARRH